MLAADIHRTADDTTVNPLARLMAMEAADGPPRKRPEPMSALKRLRKLLTAAERKAIESFLSDGETIPWNVRERIRKRVGFGQMATVLGCGD